MKRINLLMLPPRVNIHHSVYTWCPEPIPFVGMASRTSHETDTNKRYGVCTAVRYGKALIYVLYIKGGDHLKSDVGYQ